MIEKLETDPLAWGDPNYRLREMNLVICHRVYSMIDVYYGVHETEPFVFIKEFSVLHGYGLQSDS
jgi:hypothetical protein